MNSSFWYTGGALALAFAGAFLVTPLTAKIAHRFGVLDHPIENDPSGKKVHARSTPYLGGVAIFFGLVLGSSLIAIALGRDFGHLLSGFSLAIVVALVLGAIGLADDIWTVPPFARFAAQFGAAAGAWVSGFRVGITPSEEVNFVLTLLWVVGITNAFNLLDNMDGLTAGVAGIAALWFAVMGASGGMTALAIVSAALAGAAGGFLAHNRHPAKIFMGDAGSLFLGLLLALVGMRLRFDNLVEVTFIVPVVVLGLPIMDTTLVVLSRIRHGKSIFQGGRDHASHRLVRAGLSVTKSVRLLYWCCFCLGWLGFAISRSGPQVGYMLVGLVAAIGLYLGRVLWRIPAYELDASPQGAKTREDKLAYMGAVDNAADTP